ncbi:hypothetical protein B1991_17385 [Rhodanobacter lindaniclasticus]|uniref:Teneurin-like YD-shell domain-containing protein n=1 Tax=Rhodanobacter lindaniclasticus TaxID=75310 RepID=A0A4S3K8E5_9GAMM|nr:hypothetical protein B1991_17385 [Rhodanobacter lindaniclasticus]
MVLLMLWLGGVAHAGTVTYVYTDAQGTPLAEADASGNITATFDYAPYGSQALGTPPSGPGYTGHVNDPDTGLVYMQARYYDPTVGRFLSVDPVGPMPGDAFNFNRYGYADSNPITNIDMDGRCTGSNIHDKVGNCVDSGKSIVASAPSTGGVRLGQSRALTRNESAAGKEEFKNLDTGKVRVSYDSPHKESALTPNNTMHFPKSYVDCQDFVTCRSGILVGWFIHELTHVWQYQNGIDPVWGHIKSGIFKNSNYLPFKKYLRTPSPDHLNTEEQGDWHMWHYACNHDQKDGC